MDFCTRAAILPLCSRIELRLSPYCAVLQASCKQAMLCSSNQAWFPATLSVWMHKSDSCCYQSVNISKYKGWMIQPSPNGWHYTGCHVNSMDRATVSSYSLRCLTSCKSCKFFSFLFELMLIIFVKEVETVSWTYQTCIWESNNKISWLKEQPLTTVLKLTQFNSRLQMEWREKYGILPAEMLAVEA